MTCFRMPDGQTVKKYCEEHGLSYQNVWRRLDCGKSLEEAFAYKQDRPHRKLFVGRKRLNVFCGGSKTKKYRRISNYMYRGMSLKEAVIREETTYGE